MASQLSPAFTRYTGESQGVVHLEKLFASSSVVLTMTLMLQAQALADFQVATDAYPLASVACLPNGKRVGKVRGKKSGDIALANSVPRATRINGRCELQLTSMEGVS